MSVDVFPLPDLTVIPEIGSAARNLHEDEALTRARDLLIENEGDIRKTLFALEQEMRGIGLEREGHGAYDFVRIYARELVRYVEQCWATAVLA